MRLYHRLINSTEVSAVLSNLGYTVHVNKDISGLEIYADTVQVALAVWRNNKEINIISIILLYVRNDYRRKGIGSMLVRVITKYFCNKKVIMEYSDLSYNLSIMNTFLKSNGYTPFLETVKYHIDYIGFHKLINNRVRHSDASDIIIKNYSCLNCCEIEQLRKDTSTPKELHPYISPENLYTNACSLYISRKNIIQGWCIADNNKADKVFIHSLYVLPQYRNKMLGPLMLNHLMCKFSTSKSNNVNKVVFYINAQNRKALSILESLVSRKGIKTNKSYNYIVEFN